MDRLVTTDKLSKLAKALDDRAKISAEELEGLIKDVKEMLGGRSLVYVTQAEYEALSEEEKSSESIMYVITDMEQVYHVHENSDFLASLTEGNIHADSVNGYKIWVGTTEELEAIEEKDPFTVYFEIEDEDVNKDNSKNGIVQIEPDENPDSEGNHQVQLTTDRYQKVLLLDNSIIHMPAILGNNNAVEITVLIQRDRNGSDKDQIYFDFDYKKDNIYQGECTQTLTDYNYIYKLNATFIGGVSWLVECKLFSDFR